MERKTASEFPRELLSLLNDYVHGGISRREFLDGAQIFAVGGVTAATDMQGPHAPEPGVPPNPSRILRQCRLRPSDLRSTRKPKYFSIVQPFGPFQIS